MTSSVNGERAAAMGTTVTDAFGHGWRWWCALVWRRWRQREWGRITLRTTTVVVGGLLTVLTLFLLVGFGAAIGNLWTDDEDGWVELGAVVLAMAVTCGLWWLAGRYLFHRWPGARRAADRYRPTALQRDSRL